MDKFLNIRAFPAQAMHLALVGLCAAPAFAYDLACRRVSRASRPLQSLTLHAAHVRQLSHGLPCAFAFVAGQSPTKYAIPTECYRVCIANSRAKLEANAKSASCKQEI